MFFFTDIDRSSICKMIISKNFKRLLNMTDCKINIHITSTFHVEIDTVLMRDDEK